MMRIINLMVAILILSMSLTSNTYAENNNQQKGIKFEKGKWEEILKLAKENKKHIFLDCYTSWCGPCKKMAKETFTDEKVGKYFNENFISVKYDMEKEVSEEFAKELAVKAYPTVVFFNWKGEILEKAVGYRLPDQLLTLAEEVLNNKSLGYMVKQFNKGNRNPEFFKGLLLVMSKSGMNEEINKAITIYFEKKKDMAFLKEENWNIIQQYATSPYSREIRFVYDNQAELAAIYGKEKIVEKLNSVFTSHAQNYISRPDEKFVIDTVGYEKYKAYLKELNIANYDVIIGLGDIYYSARLMQHTEFSSAITDLLYKYPGTIVPEKIYEYTCHLMGYCGDREILCLAINWLNISNKLDSGEANVEKNNDMKKSVIKKITDLDPNKIGTLEGNTAPAFTLKTVEGKEVSLSDFKGKYVLLDFWASWCGPCRNEIPNVKKAYEKYKDKGFEVIGVSLDDKKDKWLKALEEEQTTWVNVHAVGGFKNKVATDYNIHGIPYILLIDKEGRVLARNARGANLHIKLDELFKKK